MLTITQRCVIAVAFALGLPASVVADTLILRNGTRVQGEFVAYRNGTIEFEERRGYGGGRTIRVDRNEVARIEFDDNDYGGGGGGVPGGGGGRGGMRERTVNVAASAGNARATEAMSTASTQPKPSRARRRATVTDQ